MDAVAVDVGLVTDPGLAEDVGASVAERLPDVLQERVAPRRTWCVHHRSHPLATGEQTALADIAAADVPVEPTWDITVLLTDLPRRAGVEPVELETSDDRRVAVVSLPTLGAVRLRTRAEQAIVGAVAQLLEADGPARRDQVD